MTVVWRCLQSLWLVCCLCWFSPSALACEHQTTEHKQVSISIQHQVQHNTTTHPTRCCCVQGCCLATSLDNLWKLLPLVKSQPIANSPQPLVMPPQQPERPPRQVVV